MHLACNDPGWYGVTHDKLLLHTAAIGADLPVPELLAVVHPRRTLPGMPTLSSPEAIISFLWDHNVYPFFAKSIDGIYSLGAVSADRLDATGQVHFADGTDRPVMNTAGEIADSKSGMLIQRRLRPDAGLADRFGRRLWSIRLFVLLAEDGPTIAQAVCKIPAPGNVADNFWRPGNMIAAVELKTGAIERVVRGTGQEMEVGFHHPETGKRIVGEHVPGWSDVLDVTRRAALIFPEVRTQSWDVALTDQGAGTPRGELGRRPEPCAAGLWPRRAGRDLCGAPAGERLRPKARPTAP
jgi:Sugar-transfer associated ATP-grasp